MGRRNHARDVGAFVLAGLAFAAWLGCGTDNGDPAGDGTGTPTDSTTSTSPTSKPTSTRPEFDASFPDDGGTPPDDGGGTPTNDGGGGLTCNDPNDVPGTEPFAKDLGTITDKDADGASVTGVVKGSTDVDFYKVVGTDTLGYVIDPTLTSSSSGVEMCMFLVCAAGTMDFQGCSGGSQATSAIGNPGCCFTAPGTTTLNYNCKGTANDTATAFIRMKQTGNLCLNYSASYHF